MNCFTALWLALSCMRHAAQLSAVQLLLSEICFSTTSQVLCMRFHTALLPLNTTSLRSPSTAPQGCLQLPHPSKTPTGYHSVLKKSTSLCLPQGTPTKLS